MKIITERDALAPALDAAYSCVARKPVVAVTGCFRLGAANGALHAMGNDMDGAMEAKVAAEVARPGEIAVPAENLRSIVKASPAGSQVQIEATDPDRVTVRIGRSRYTLSGLSPQDFPMAREIAPRARSAEFCVTADEAQRLFALPRPFVATDANEANMGGAWLHLRGGKLWSLGMNRYRFFAAAVERPSGWDDDDALSFPGIDQEPRPGVVIPPQTMDGLLRALERGGRVVTDGRSIIAAGPAMRFAGGLLINQMPPAWSILPEAAPTRVEVDRDEMAAALKRLSVLDEKNARVELSCAAGDDMLQIRLARSSAGEGEEAVRLAEEAEHGFSLLFAHSILSLAIASAKGERVSLAYEDKPRRAGSSPIVRIEWSGDQHALCVAAALTDTAASAAPAAGDQ